MGAGHPCPMAQWEVSSENCRFRHTLPQLALVKVNGSEPQALAPTLDCLSLPNG